MYKLFFFFLLFFSMLHKAEAAGVLISRDTVPSGVPQLFGGKYYKFNGYMLVDSFIMTAPGDTNAIPRYPALKFKSSDNYWYAHNRSRWQRLLYAADPSLLNTARHGVHRSGDTVKAGSSLNQFNDSTIYYFMPARHYVDGPATSIIISNTNKDSISATASTGTQGTVYNSTAFLVNSRFYEANNDTLNLQYGGAIGAHTFHGFDSSSTRFRYDNKKITLPTLGYAGIGRFFAPRDSVVVSSFNDGGQGSEFYGEYSIGESWGYNVYIEGLPHAVFKNQIDLQRVLSRGRRRKMTGEGVAGYFSNWKNYQGSINPATVNDSSYHSKIFDFYAAGENVPGTITATKAKVLEVSKVDTAIGFYSAPQYTSTNSVYNGYGFVSAGADDYNWMAGRLRIGSTWPSKYNGALRYNLEAPGSTRTDSLFLKYQQFDSTGRMVFTSKNDAAYSSGGSARFGIDFRATLDSNAAGNTVPGGLFMFRNWTNYKTQAIAWQAAMDARNYFILTANRSATMGTCITCPNSEFHGYKQIQLANGSTLSNGAHSIPPTIFLSRLELHATSGNTTGDAPTLELAGYTSQFTGASGQVQNIGFVKQFNDIGSTNTSIQHGKGYFSFYSGVSNLANYDSTFGFFQANANVRNQFRGTMEVPNTSLVASVGTNHVVLIDSVSGLHRRIRASELAAAGLPTFSNGLTLAAGTVSLGGALTGLTEITGNQTLSLGSTGSRLANLNVFSNNRLSIYAGINYSVDATNTDANHTVPVNVSIVEVSDVLTADRTFTMPAASQNGQMLTVVMRFSAGSNHYNLAAAIPDNKTGSTFTQLEWATTYDFMVDQTLAWRLIRKY